MNQTENGRPGILVSPETPASEHALLLEDPRVIRALEEYRAALEAGVPIDRQEFQARHPEISAALAECLDGLEFIHTAAPQLQPSAADDPGLAPAAAALHPEGPLGDYRIVREVGRGGMGVVYEAVQISLGRRVALKVLPFASTLDARQLQRFKNEAHAAAQLHHTNIVPIHATGCERGVHYYAMQFIDGQTLADIIEELQRLTGPAGNAPADATGPWTPAQPGPETPATQTGTPTLAALVTERSARSPAFFRTVARLGIQAAEALEHAHQMGIVHRDIKPANLLVDGHGNLWVADFGLAQVLSDTKLTLTGDLVGTLRYMSPEQALASRILVDQRTDIYSLGVTLYELLTLQPAFAGNDRQELLRRVAFEEPLPPRRINKSIPGELETIVLKTLAKNPAERYATAQEMADDLRRWLEDKPIHARRPTIVQRMRRWSRRHQAVVWPAAGVILLGAAIGVTALAISNVQITAAYQAEAAQRSIADEALVRTVAAERLAQERLEDVTQQKQHAEENAAIARAVNAFLQDDLLGQSDIRNQGGGERNRNITVRELLDRAGSGIDARFPGQELTEAAIRLTLGDAYEALGEYPEAQRHLERAVALRKHKLGADHADTLKSMNQLALLYRNRGRYDEAEQLFKQVVEAFRAKLGTDHSDMFASMNNLALVYADRGRYDEAEQLLKQTLEAHRVKLGADHPDTLNSINNLAALYHRRGRYDQVEPLFKQVLEGRRVKLGPDHPNTLESMNDLAVCYCDRGRYVEAEPLFKHVLQARRVKLGDDHPATLASMDDLAGIYRFRGRYDEVERLLKQVLEGRRSKLGADHPLTLATMAHLALLYVDRGRYGEAEPLFKQVLESRRAKLGTDHPDTLSSIDNLAELYSYCCRYDEAEPLYKQALAGRRVKLAANHPDTLSSIHNLAALYQARGRYDEAEPLFMQVLEGSRIKLGADHPRTLTSMNNLATLYHVCGRYDEAEPLFCDAVAGARKQLGVGHPHTQGFINNLINLHDRCGQLERSEPLLREFAEHLKAKAGPTSPAYAGQLARLSSNLLKQKKYGDAEPVARECLAVRAKNEPDVWTTFNTQSLLGAALLGQQKYADAEPSLVQGYTRMKQCEAKIPPQGKVRLTEALERLVQLYEAWGKKDKADAWRKTLEEARAAANPAAKP